jgi:hypothetical protein
MRLNNILF